MFEWCGQIGKLMYLDNVNMGIYEFWIISFRVFLEEVMECWFFLLRFYAMLERFLVWVVKKGGSGCNKNLRLSVKFCNLFSLAEWKHFVLYRMENFNLCNSFMEIKYMVKREQVFQKTIVFNFFINFLWVTCIRSKNVHIF